jgi:hypothetical protein
MPFRIGRCRRPAEADSLWKLVELVELPDGKRGLDISEDECYEFRGASESESAFSQPS